MKRKLISFKIKIFLLIVTQFIHEQPHVQSYGLIKILFISLPSFNYQQIFLLF